EGVVELAEGVAELHPHGHRLEALDEARARAVPLGQRAYHLGVVHDERRADDVRLDVDVVELRQHLPEGPLGQRRLAAGARLGEALGYPGAQALLVEDVEADPGAGGALARVVATRPQLREAELIDMYCTLPALCKAV